MQRITKRECRGVVGVKRKCAIKNLQRFGVLLLHLQLAYIEKNFIDALGAVLRFSALRGCTLLALGSACLLINSQLVLTRFFANLVDQLLGVGGHLLEFGGVQNVSCQVKPSAGRDGCKLGLVVVLLCKQALRTLHIRTELRSGLLAANFAIAGDATDDGAAFKHGLCARALTGGFFITRQELQQRCPSIGSLRPLALLHRSLRSIADLLGINGERNIVVSGFNILGFSLCRRRCWLLWCRCWLLWRRCN